MSAAYPVDCEVTKAAMRAASKLRGQGMSARSPKGIRSTGDMLHADLKRRGWPKVMLDFAPAEYWIKLEDSMKIRGTLGEPQRALLERFVDRRISGPRVLDILGVE